MSATADSVLTGASPQSVQYQCNLTKGKTMSKIKNIWIEDFYPVERLMKGEVVRRKKDAKKTYRVDGYCRYERKYLLADEDDISREIAVKKGTLLYAGFIY